MKNFEIIDTTPCDEKCCPIENRAGSQKEARAFINQIKRQFLTDAVEFKVVWCPHDFGSYPQIFVYYDIDDPEAERQAIDIVNELPEKWDDEARKELQ